MDWSDFFRLILQLFVGTLSTGFALAVVLIFLRTSWEGNSKNKPQKSNLDF